MSHVNRPEPPPIPVWKIVAFLVATIFVTAAFAAGSDSLLFDIVTWVLAVIVFVALVLIGGWVVFWLCRASLR